MTQSYILSFGSPFGPMDRQEEISSSGASMINALYFDPQTLPEFFRVQPRMPGGSPCLTTASIKASFLGVHPSEFQQYTAKTPHISSDVYPRLGDFSCIPLDRPDGTFFL